MEGRISMREPRLRVYYGPEEKEEITNTTLAEETRVTVTVSLGAIFPLLAEAIRGERTWLRDFEDDELTISSDLHEVLLAYQHYQRPTG
jgi:hypothetical protein